MISFIEIRDKIRNYISRNASWIGPISKALLTLASLIAVNISFGYNSVLSNPIVIIILSVLSAFIPLAGSMVIIVLYGIVHLVSLSYEVAVATIIMLAVLYALCVFYRGSQVGSVVFMPVFMEFRLPFCVPVYVALFCDLREISTVVCGAVFSFYLKAVANAAPSFLDDSVDITVMDIITQNLIANYMFYIYIASTVALYLIIYFVRNSRTDNAWLKAITFGLLTQLVMMMAGYLFTGNIDRILPLIIGDVVTFVFGLIMIYIFRDLDYTRIENVQFEDDEYYYHVTAIPKIGLADEELKVKRVTQYRSSIGRKNRQKKKDMNNTLGQSSPERRQ